MDDDLEDSGIEDNCHHSVHGDESEAMPNPPIPALNSGSPNKGETVGDYLPETGSSPAAWLLEQMDDIRLETLKSHFFPNGPSQNRIHQLRENVSYRGIGLTKEQFASAVSEIIGTNVIWEAALELHDRYARGTPSLFQTSITREETQPANPRLLFWEQIVDAFLEEPSESEWTPLETPQVFRAEHSKREPIVRVIPVQTTKSFCYVVVSRWGRVGVHDAAFKLLESYRVKLGRLTEKVSARQKGSNSLHENFRDVESTGDRRRGLPWINDVVFLPDALSLIFLCSDSSLQVWSAEWLVHSRKWTVMSIPSVVLSAAYRPSLSKNLNGVSATDMQSQLFVGDEEGFVTTITFLQPRSSLFRPKDTENRKDEFFWAELRFQTEWVRINTEQIHSCAVNELRYFSEGNVGISVSYDPSASIVFFWPTERKSKTILKLSSGPTCITMSRSRRAIVAGCRDGSIQLWPLPPSIPPVTLQSNEEVQLGEEAIRDVCFVNNLVLSVNDKGVLKLWNIQIEKCIQMLKLPTKTLKSQAVSSLPRTPHRLFPGPARVSLSENVEIHKTDSKDLSCDPENSVGNSNKATGTVSPTTSDDSTDGVQSMSLDKYPMDIGVSCGTGVILIPFCPPPKPPPLLPLSTETPRRVIFDSEDKEPHNLRVAVPPLRTPDRLPQPGYPSSLRTTGANQFDKIVPNPLFQIENKVQRLPGSGDCGNCERDVASLLSEDPGRFPELDTSDAPKPREITDDLRSGETNLTRGTLPPPPKPPLRDRITDVLYPAEAKSLVALGVDPEANGQQTLPSDLLKLLEAAQASVKSLVKEKLSGPTDQYLVCKSSEMKRLVEECAPHLALRLTPEKPISFSRKLPMSTRMRTRKLDLSEPKRLIAAKLPMFLHQEETSSSLSPLRAIAHVAGSYMVGTADFFKRGESNDEAFDRLCRASKFFPGTDQK